MKEGIHPEYNQTTITCACGNVLEVGSTKKRYKSRRMFKMPSILDRKLKTRNSRWKSRQIQKEIWTCISQQKVAKELLFLYSRKVIIV